MDPWEPTALKSLKVDPYRGGPTIENASLMDFLDIEKEDSKGLETPFIDPINVAAGGLAGMATSGLMSGLAQLPGMIASEVPIGLGLEAIDEYSDSNPFVNMVAGLALPIAAGRYLEPHVNKFFSNIFARKPVNIAIDNHSFDLQDYATMPEKIDYYIKKNGGNVDKYDVIMFDDATFFKQPNGSYTDHPDYELSDMSFDNLFQVRRAAEDSYDGKLSDYTIDNAPVWKEFIKKEPEKNSTATILNFPSGLMR